VRDFALGLRRLKSVILTLAVVLLAVSGFIADWPSVSFYDTPAPWIGETGILIPASPGKISPEDSLSVSITSPGISGDDQRLPCRFSIYVAQGALHRRHIISVEHLNKASEYPAGRTITFAAPSIRIPTDTNQVEVRNLGCEKGFRYRGGVMSMGLAGEQVSIAILSGICFWLGVAFAFAFLAMSMAQLVTAYLCGRKLPAAG
jgi:hypothetical protein